MKKIALIIAGIGIAATTVPAASAQAGWQSISQRGTQVERKIEDSIRSGRLTQASANKLRVEFRSITDLENRYRRSAPGLTAAERNDLDRRYNALLAKVPVGRPVAQAPAYWQMNERKAVLERRIEDGVRKRQLTRQEATRLRAEFNAIVQLEAKYRRSAPGLTQAEIKDLDHRFEALARKIRWERSDWERRR